MKSIPTKYRGITYRSRLEARWAVFFELLGWGVTYEPFDGNGYIPDFVIHSEKLAVLVEVKPASTKAELLSNQDKVLLGTQGIWSGRVLLLGLSPFAIINDGDTYLGLMDEAEGEWAQEYVSLEPTDNGLVARRLLGAQPGSLRVRDFSEARLGECHECGRWGLCSVEFSYRTSPCGHHKVSDSQARLKHFWNLACETVRWQP